LNGTLLYVSVIMFNCIWYDLWLFCIFYNLQVNMAYSRWGSYSCCIENMLFRCGESYWSKKSTPSHILFTVKEVFFSRQEEDRTPNSSVIYQMDLSADRQLVWEVFLGFSHFLCHWTIFYPSSSPWPLCFEFSFNFP
jgi:hypothetical protein